MNWLDGVWGWPVWKNSVVLHNLRTPMLPQGPRCRVLNHAIAVERVNRGLEKIQKHLVSELGHYSQNEIHAL